MQGSRPARPAADPGQALAELSQSTATYPTVPRPYREVARLHEQLGSQREARRWTRKAEEVARVWLPR